MVDATASINVKCHPIACSTWLDLLVLRHYAQFQIHYKRLNTSIAMFTHNDHRRLPFVIGNKRHCDAVELIEHDLC